MTRTDLIELMAQVVFPNDWRPRPETAGPHFEANLADDQHRSKVKLEAALAAIEQAGMVVVPTAEVASLRAGISKVAEALGGYAHTELVSVEFLETVLSEACSAIEAWRVK